MSADTAFEVGRLFAPIKAIADTLTTGQKDVFVGLPGLLSYWPMGVRRESGIVADHSGSNLILGQTGVCPTGYDGNAYTHLGDGTNYVQSSYVAFGLTGAETFIDSSIRGLTLGGWFWIDAAPASFGGLISRSANTPNRSYEMRWQSSNTVRLVISGDGTAAPGVISGGANIGTWNFIVGRFVPSTSADVFVNGVKTTSTTSIPASLFVASATFEIGRAQNDNLYLLHCRARDVFICAASLSDALIEQVRVASSP